MTSKDIPHADLIRAVLAGKVVQWGEDGEWLTYDSAAAALGDLIGKPDSFQYRLKPEPVVWWRRHENL